ncbi:MAG: YlxR family protein [Solobacterium sp.]|nr:YlxR family protein [Solobacterium sp.]MBR2669912.1 YlxR family protein [Solobacterium sp.]
MPRKIPMRKCVATGEQLPKKELLRIVRHTDGTVGYDPTGKANGRGAYIKNSLEALMTAKKNNALKKALEVEIPEEFWEEMKKIVKQ